VTEAQLLHTRCIFRPSHYATWDHKYADDDPAVAFCHARIVAGVILQQAALFRSRSTPPALRFACRSGATLRDERTLNKAMVRLFGVGDASFPLERAWRSHHRRRARPRLHRYGSWWRGLCRTGFPGPRRACLGPGLPSLPGQGRLRSIERHGREFRTSCASRSYTCRARLCRCKARGLEPSDHLAMKVARWLVTLACDDCCGVGSIATWRRTKRFRHLAFSIHLAALRSRGPKEVSDEDSCRLRDFL
jgi:hypothetical protein